MTNGKKTVEQNRTEQRDKQTDSDGWRGSSGKNEAKERKNKNDDGTRVSLKG